MTEVVRERAMSRNPVHLLEQPDAHRVEHPGKGRVMRLIEAFLRRLPRIDVAAVALSRQVLGPNRLESIPVTRQKAHRAYAWARDRQRIKALKKTRRAACEGPIHFQLEYETFMLQPVIF